MQNYSVLMTIYVKDNPDYVKLSIDSMLQQTIQTNDFVLICDGPLNKELDSILDFYDKNYKFFNIIRLPQNVGLGAALKEGVIHCKNTLIARMDDDDIAKPLRCELELMEFEKNENLDICGAYMNEFDINPDNPVRIKQVPVTHDEIKNFSKRRNPFNHSTVMFKKDRIISVGNYSSMRTNQDVDLWVRALNYGLQGYNIAQPLVDFRFDANTYARRKNLKNVKLMLKVWENFWKSKYCSLGDYIYVIVVQLAIYLMPNWLLRWSYDHVR